MKQRYVFYLLLTYSVTQDAKEIESFGDLAIFSYFSSVFADKPLQIIMRKDDIVLHMKVIVVGCSLSKNRLNSSF